MLARPVTDPVTCTSSSRTILVRVEPGSPDPIYAQIAAAVRREVAAGRVRPGERLPGARELAAALRVTLHTVLRGYQELS